jgi:hypothetical protein
MEDSEAFGDDGCDTACKGGWVENASTSMADTIDGGENNASNVAEVASHG